MSNVSGCCVDKLCTPSTCMVLPLGASCGTCKHIAYCKALGYTRDEARTSCDFFPRRYLPKVP